MGRFAATPIGAIMHVDPLWEDNDWQETRPLHFTSGVTSVELDVEQVEFDGKYYYQVCMVL